MGASLAGPVAVLFGNEAHGLDGAVRERSDMVVRIPMRAGAESLNLAAAAAVILFEAARRRRPASAGWGPRAAPPGLPAAMRGPLESWPHGREPRGALGSGDGP